jgi:hypothetical protein
VSSLGILPLIRATAVLTCHLDVSSSLAMSFLTRPPFPSLHSLHSPLSSTSFCRLFLALLQLLPWSLLRVSSSRGPHHLFPEDDPAIIVCGPVLRSVPLPAPSLSKPGGSGPDGHTAASPLQPSLTRPDTSVPGGRPFGLLAHPSWRAGGTTPASSSGLPPRLRWSYGACSAATDPSCGSCSVVT